MVIQGQNWGQNVGQKYQDIDQNGQNWFQNGQNADSTSNLVSQTQRVLSFFQSHNQLHTLISTFIHHFSFSAMELFVQTFHSVRVQLDQMVGRKGTAGKSTIPLKGDLVQMSQMGGENNTLSQMSGQKGSISQMEGRGEKSTIDLKTDLAQMSHFLSSFSCSTIDYITST